MTNTIVETVVFRPVAEESNEKGLYPLEKFDVPDLDEPFSESEDLAEVFSTIFTQWFDGECQWFEVLEDFADETGMTLEFEQDGEQLSIPDIRRYIDLEGAESDFVRFFVVADHDQENIVWFVLMSADSEI